MAIDLRTYQAAAVTDLTTKVKILLEHDGTGKICVFQAPTGSGKTLMTAKFVEQILKELPDDDLCFVWVSIGKGDLHLQSKRALEKIFVGAPKVALVEDEFAGGREEIARNELVVVNWEKLRSKDRATGDWKNVLMKDGEKVNFRDVLASTRLQRQIILIIDESHIGATAERTQELRTEIDADVILEMSATPKLVPDRRDEARGRAAYVYVDPKDVIEEGVIKKELIINEGIDKIANEEADSQETILEAAYKKQKELKKAFEAEGSKINPLVLVQIPTAEAGEDKKEAVKAFLARKGISESNRKLAIWLAEQKSETLDWISDPANEVQFLIFKQAVDTGWDCPRAHILVKFRESHSETFEIQTVGRILRMPELKHYDTESLNIGYIYTNVPSILVKREEYNPNIIKHIKSSRKDCYTNLKLPAFYRSRVDYGDITASFDVVFEKTACATFAITTRGDSANNIRSLGKCGVKVNTNRCKQDILRDANIEGISFDDLSGEIFSDKTARLYVAGNDLQAQFEQIIRDNLGSFRNVKRSVPRVKSAIYAWFRDYLGSAKWDEEAMLVQKIFSQEGNRKPFEAVLAKAIEAYRLKREKELEQRAEAGEQYYDFDVPRESFFNEHVDERVVAQKYLHDPCYLSRERTLPEKGFEQFLETARIRRQIGWWWKNGENKKDFFGIRYEYPKGEVHTFYPDYLVQRADGKVAILEAKDRRDQDGASSTKAKAEQLHKYIKDQNGKGHELVGGIVIQVGAAWKVNQKSIYDWEKCLKNDWSDWQDLTLA
jgi:type III restriction enzyme